MVLETRGIGDGISQRISEGKMGTLGKDLDVTVPGDGADVLRTYSGVSMVDWDT